MSNIKDLLTCSTQGELDNEAIVRRAREEAYQRELKRAKRSHQRLKSHDCALMREQIMETASSSGLAAVWLSVFSCDEDMLRRLETVFSNYIVHN